MFRKFLVAILLLLLLTVFVAAVAFVLPAHVQVRDVAPALPEVAELRALLDIDNGPVDVRFVATSSQATGDRVLGHTSVIVRWADGRLFVIDLGMDREQAEAFGELMTTVMGSGIVSVHGTIADLMAEEIERVQGVGFTHLHIDHTQGVENFCAARGEGAALVQTRQQHELHNFNTEEGAELVGDSCLVPLQLTGDKLTGVDGFPGLAVYPLGGHTPGSTLFAIAWQDRLLLLSGDITNSRADLLENRGKGFIYSYLLVPENTERTGELRGWLADLDSATDIDVLVAHDLNAIESVLQPLDSGSR
jgi:glyoxylase-like metal-dependent hydrolase (beta-lactamase superfamily II)